MKLKLADWSDIAEIVTAIAVVCSLAYIGYELHLNTIEMRSANIQAVSASGQALAVAVATNPDLAKSLGVPLEELNSFQVIQIRLILASVLRATETAFILYSDGMLEKRYWWGKAEEILLIMENEAWKRQWRLIRGRYDPDFAEWLDQAIKDRYGA